MSNIQSSITNSKQHQVTRFKAQIHQDNKIYTNIIMKFKNNWDRILTSWRTEVGIVLHKAQQRLKSSLQCLMKWLMMNLKLQHTRIQLNLQNPWNLQALNLAKYSTVCFDSTSKSPQKHLMSMNSSIEKVLVWRNWKIFWEKKLENFLI